VLSLLVLYPINQRYSQRQSVPIEETVIASCIAIGPKRVRKRDGGSARCDLSEIGGFTLIELSIVLVIIGLLVGGVLVGRDLIYAAEVRNAIKDVETIRTAISTFQGKYNCLPGDCKNATTFFSNLAPDEWSAGTWLNNLRNGNGNDQYDSFQEGTFRFWEQLTAAKLWPGSFNGTYGSDGLVPGVNLPVFSWFAPNATSGVATANNITKFSIVATTGHIGYPDSGSGWESGQPLVAGGYTSNGKNRLGLVGMTENSSKFRTDHGLNCGFMWNIDTKMDDGMPHTGQVRTYGEVDWQSCSGWDYRNGIPPATGYTYHVTNTYESGTLFIDQ